MKRPPPVLLTIATATAALDGCRSAAVIGYPPVPDAAGCVIEAVAVAPDRDQFSFRGVSPDGRLIAIGFSGGSDSAKGTFLLDVATGHRTPIPELNNGGSFSPDGRYLVAAVNRGGRRWDLVEYDRDTHDVREIAPDSAADFLPSYSPDGRLIVFNSYRTGRSDVYVYDRTTRGLRRLTTFDGYDAHAQFAPDGRAIVFHREVTRGDYNLVLLDFTTGTERTLTSAPGEESYPAFSPNGDYLVYSDDRAHPGASDLAVMTLGTGAVSSLTNSGSRDGYATWTRDGKYIYFTSHRSGRIGVYRIPMKGPDCVRTASAGGT
jgi:Tol biopolymer transport system component